MSNGIALTNAPSGCAGSFEDEVINSPVPVLIDFWAGWCGPCRMIAPFIDQIADEYAGRLKVCKVDVDAEGELAQRFGIVSIPALLVFNKGEVVQQQAGAVPKHMIEALFKDLV